MNTMKVAFANLVKKSLGISVVLLFIMYASVHAQTVDMNNARIDTLVSKICRTVPGLKGIPTATPADLQTLSDYASIGLKYTVYSTEFQKIQTACQSLGINILPVDRLLPQDERKMVSKIAFIIANDVITTILEGASISGGNFNNATIPQIKAAIAKAQDEKKNKEGLASGENGYKKSLLMLVANKLGTIIVMGTSKIESLELDAQVAQSLAKVEELKANITNIDAGQKDLEAEKAAKLARLKDTEAEIAKIKINIVAMKKDIVVQEHTKDSLKTILEKQRAIEESAEKLAKSLQTEPK